MAKRGKTEDTNPVGRPPKFDSVETLQALIDDYFLQAKTDGEPYTVTGLALALDTTRETLMDYEKKPEFSDAIKRAKTRVEHYAEMRLYGATPTGAIFCLKNFGWKDKQDLEHTGAGGSPLIPVMNVSIGKSGD